MALPPGFLDELRARISLAQVAGRKLTWDPRKSNPGKGDYWAPCPFHQEKTPSFHVDDRKGFYYCFGCHAKGDAVGFVKETENVGFMEAVEILAREAGMALPAPDPAARARAERQTDLAGIMEQAVRFYRMQLRTAAAAPARDYLAGRGLDTDALDRFEIGFAPDSRQTLWAHLTGKGIAPDKIVEAGLAARPDDGGAPYDRFRGRIQFPIRDPRGRCMAFGGRAMAADARAKYLNSPETPLFDKGRTLYNFGPAREAAGSAAPLIVAEGYMDVIALVQGGFAASVAPLGTAITQTQLDMLWRLAPEPIVALDGDAAGLRAAHRLIDLALPLIEPGKSLRFALLPSGQDPDDLIRAGGPAAMQSVLDQAVPVVTLLWRRETDGQNFDSPERRAALDARLGTSIGRIRDPGLRRHMFDAVKALRTDLFGFPPDRPARPPRGKAPRRGWPLAPAGATQSARNSLLVRDTRPNLEETLRETVILAIGLQRPDLVDDLADRLEALDCHDTNHKHLLAALLRHAPTHRDDPAAFQAAIEADHGRVPLEKLHGAGHLQVIPALMPGADSELGRKTLISELDRLLRQRGARREIAHATEDLDHPAGEGLTWRLREAAAVLHGTAHAEEPEDDTEDTLSDRLQSMIDAEVWIKKRPVK